MQGLVGIHLQRDGDGTEFAGGIEQPRQAAQLGAIGAVEREDGASRNARSALEWRLTLGARPFPSGGLLLAEIGIAETDAVVAGCGRRQFAQRFEGCRGLNQAGGMTARRPRRLAIACARFLIVGRRLVRLGGQEADGQTCPTRRSTRRSAASPGVRWRR